MLVVVATNQCNLEITRLLILSKSIEFNSSKDLKPFGRDVFLLIIFVLTFGNYFELMAEYHIS